MKKEEDERPHKLKHKQSAEKSMNREILIETAINFTFNMLVKCFICFVSRKSYNWNFTNCHKYGERDEKLVKSGLQ